MTIVIAEIEQDQHLLVSSLFGCIVVFWLLQYWTLLLSFQSGAKIQPSHWKPLVSRSRNTRKESFLWQGRVVNLQTPLLVCRLLRASEECCLWRAAFGRSMEPAPWDPWCPSCPAGTLLLHLWPYKEKCLYSRGNGRGQEASLLRRRWMLERPRPRRHEVPTRLPLRESHPCMCEAASGTWQLSCYQMQHVNRMQQETKIPSGRNCSAQKKGERKGDSKLHTDIEPRIKNPRLEGASWNTPWVLGIRIPGASLGSVVLLFPPASRQHRHISRCSGVRSRGVPARWMAALPVLEQRWNFTAGRHRSSPLAQGAGIKGRPLCCHGNRNARQR